MEFGEWGLHTEAIGIISLFQALTLHFVLQAKRLYQVHTVYSCALCVQEKTTALLFAVMLPSSLARNRDVPVAVCLHRHRVRTTCVSTSQCLVSSRPWGVWKPPVMSVELKSS